MQGIISQPSQFYLHICCARIYLPFFMAFRAKCILMIWNRLFEMCAERKKTAVRKPNNRFLFAFACMWQKLVVFCLDLEVCLCVFANRTNFRCIFADNNVSAVRALPNHIAVA